MSLIIGIIILLIIIIAGFWIIHVTAKFHHQRVALRIMLNLEELRETCQTIQTNMPKLPTTPYVELSHMTHLIETNFARASYDLAKSIYMGETGSGEEGDYVSGLVSAFKMENGKLTQLTKTLIAVRKKYDDKLADISAELDHFESILAKIQRRNAELV